MAAAQPLKISNGQVQQLDTTDSPQFASLGLGAAPPSTGITISSGNLILDDGVLGLDEQASDPSNVANRGFVYTKDTSGISELYYEDDSGQVIQFSSNGAINVALGAGERQTVQTTDATVTTLFTKTMTAGSARMFQVFASAVDSGDTLRSGYTRSIMAYRTAAGSATLGQVQDDYTDESDTALDVTFSTSGNDVLVRVTGKAATTIDWEGILFDSEATPGTSTGEALTVTAVQTSSPVTAAIDELVRVDTDTVGANTTVNLPAVATTNKGQKVVVKMSFGTAGNTATYKAIVTPDGTDTIDGGSTFDITGERGGATFYSDGTSNWEVL